MNILIVKMSAIGDVIHTLPALNSIRNHFPDAHINWLVEEAAADLVVGHEALDRVIVSKRKQWVRQLFSRSFLTGAANILTFVQELRDTRYDIIIDFQGLLKSGAMVMLAKGDMKAGFDRGMDHAEYSYLFYNRRIPPISMEIHALKRGLMMLEALGIPTKRVEYKLPVSSDDHKTIAVMLEEREIDPERRLVCINPQATWKTKLWDNRLFAELSDALQERYGVQVVFTGGPYDGSAIDTIMAITVRPCVSLAGLTTLKTLAALYQRADLLITTDTGPMHLGAAAGTRVVAIFGSTAPWRTGPYGSNHGIVRSNIACSPCFKRHCPHCNCMHGITVEKVLSSIKNQLEMSL